MIAYVDIFSGISGDMALGAMVDLGVPVDYLKEHLSGMLDGFDLKAEKVLNHHLSATDIEVAVDDHSSVSRNYTDIREMIEKAVLPEKVKQNSLTAFEKIGMAESGIHGKNIETIHFHEVGGIDSIVDIVGTFLAVDYLGITKVFASSIPLGSGTVKCSHGTIPVPVPATLSILKGIPVRSSDAQTEIVTPTGAAIITTLAESFGPMPDMIIDKTGYGSGKRDTGSSLPNLLRVCLGTPAASQPVPDILVEQVMTAKTNVDDMSPEGLGFLMTQLFEHHALDVTFCPVQMKKNRPGVQIEVICRQTDLDDIVALILSSTSSIGVRYHACSRSCLKREAVSADTSLGSVSAKAVIRPGGQQEIIPEYESVARLAREKQMPFKTVYDKVFAEANSLDRE